MIEDHTDQAFQLAEYRMEKGHRKKAASLLIGVLQSRLHMYAKAHAKTFVK